MWHRAFVVSGLLALAGCPDKNSPERQMRAAAAQMAEFADSMCRCSDKACADKVQDDLTTWATRMAKESSSKPPKPDEELMKRMTDIGQRYAECMAKAMTYTKPELVAPRDDVPPASTTRDADALVREARAWARAKQPEHLVTDARFDYVDAKGALDAEFGAVEITFGRPAKKADDPKRKTGAPATPTTSPEDCFMISWSPATSWSRTTYGCGDAVDVANRCTVTQIWRKAIEAKAPEDALAKIEMRPLAAGAGWTFVIQDEPRGVDIRQSFADDCPLAVEK